MRSIQRNFWKPAKTGSGDNFDACAANSREGNFSMEFLSDGSGVPSVKPDRLGMANHRTALRGQLI